MKVNVSDAAKLAGLSRPYFHMQYVKTGKITVERDDNGKPQIDTAELLRIFGKLSDNKQHNTETEHEITAKNNTENSHLQLENQLLREQLSAAIDDKKWLQQTVDRLTQTLNMLEHKPEPKRGWIARLFGK